MASVTPRQLTLVTVADGIVGLAGAGVTLVGVDGVDGAGKTHFADELAEALGVRDVPVIRASVDGFHHPAEVRHRRGRTSPEGFFRDSYNYDALRELLLDPLCTGGGRFVRAVYDVHQEQRVTREVEVAREGDVLVFDGIFVHRPELRCYWDYSIFLDVDFATSIPRGARRGYGHPDPASPGNRRYIDGQRIYLSECRPDEHATVVIDNNDLAGAHIIHRPTGHGTTGQPREEPCGLGVTVGLSAREGGAVTRLVGQVASGTKDLARWMRTYRDAYREATGAELVPGSLNVMLDREYRFPRDCIHLGADQTGVGVSLVPCCIEGWPAFLFRTDRTEAGLGDHPRDVVEIVADVHLREELGLHDGDTVEIVLPGDGMTDAPGGPEVGRGRTDASGTGVENE